MVPQYVLIELAWVRGGMPSRGLGAGAGAGPGRRGEGPPASRVGPLVALDHPLTLPGPPAVNPHL